MSSWQASCLGLAVRACIRRRDWGDTFSLTRRARRVFGAPRALGWVWTRGLRIEAVCDDGAARTNIRGEWLNPPRPEAGTTLYIHGGGFVSCSSTTHRPITANLARFTRRRVFSLDYRLAPEHCYPSAVDDALAAYRWLLGRSEPVQPLVLAGDSAGGGLVLSTLLRAREEGLPLPAAALCFSPWADLAGTGESVRANDGRCAMFHPNNLKDFAAAYLGKASPLDPLASPVFANLSGLPPLLLQVGSTELLLDDSRRVHEKIQLAGGTSRLEIFDGVFHGWQMLTGMMPEAHAALRQAAAFIGESCA